MHRAISRPKMVKTAVVSRAEKMISAVQHLSRSAVVDTGFFAFSYIHTYIHTYIHHAYIDKRQKLKVYNDV